MGKALIYGILINVCFFSMVYAQSKDECSIRAEESLAGSFEKKIYHYYPELLRGFIVCDQLFFDRLMGMLHEGLHFLDLDYREIEKKLVLVENGELPFTRNMFFGNVVIHFKDESKAGIPQFETPFAEPKTLLNSFLDSNPIEKTRQFSDFYHEYIYGSEDSPAAGSSMFPGLVMEWSAYLHGYDFSIPRAQNLIRPMTQGEGFIFFIVATELYLNQLESNFPEQIQAIKASPEAMIILKKLELESKNLLNSFDYCNEYKNDDSVLKTVIRLPKTNTIGNLTASTIDLNSMLNSCFKK